MKKELLIADLDALVARHIDPADNDIVLALAIVDVTRNALQAGVINALAENVAGFARTMELVQMVHPRVFSRPVDNS